MSRVLVVETSETTRRMMYDLFESAGHTVLASETGEHALETARRERPDLVVTASDLPGLDGIVLTRLLKRESPAPLVVVLADSDSGREHMRAHIAGADAVVQREPESIQTLPSLLDGRSASEPTRTDTEHEAEEQDDQTTLEAVSRRYDRELFVAEMVNRVWGSGEQMQSLDTTAREILQTLLAVLEIDIAAVVLLYEREARVFTLPGSHVFEDDVRQFVELAREDFARRPGTEMVRSVNEHVIGTDDREDYAHVRIDGRRISSYHTVALERSDGTLVGTLHLGQLTNNFFVGRITEEIERISHPVSVVLANAVRYSETEERRRKINTIFAKFVPEEVISDLLSQSENTEMAVGEKRTVAILFSDIRSFTVISEHNSAETIVSFLNAYLERMVRIIRGYGGFIDKFIGDAILAIFGAPVSYEDNAARAVYAARDMAAAVSEVDVKGLVLPEGGFSTGIGVHEGTVIVGNIGSQDKFDYTVIGDNVNLASRLEGLTKHYHAKVLMSDVVYRKVADEMTAREVDTVRVMGKERATTLYTTVADGTFTEQSAADYRKALSMYKLGNWSTATGYFSRVLQRNPDDYLAAMYIDRCREFAANPPEEDWGGAIKLDFK